MGFYANHILPCLIDLACSSRPVLKQRRKVVPLAQGRVLEVGIGSAINIDFYNADKVEQVWGLEPSAGMLRKAGRHLAGKPIVVSMLNAGAEEIPLATASMDTVLLTYTLCTIPQWMLALAEMRRVLKPGGRLVFCEHGAAPDEKVRRWQDRLNPAWSTIAGGCNLNRNIPDALMQSGFRIETMDTGYIPKTPRIFAYNYWGLARPR